jgi:transcriptional regulator with XRE-family HTH domain
LAVKKIKTYSGKLGSRIKRARMAAGLSQRELARKAGASLSSIERWEGDGSVPLPASLRAIARVCKVPVTYLSSQINVHMRTAARNKNNPARAEIGKRLRMLRGDLTQREFSRKIGVTPRAYLRYEPGQRPLCAFQIIDICKACGVSANWFLMGKGRKKLKV